MRILCISPVYPPRDSESFCTGKMVLALQQSGVDVSMIYMDSPEWSERGDTSAVWNALPDAVGIIHRPNESRLHAALLALKYHTVAWPRWVSKTVQCALELHRAARFDVIYSRSPPMSGHLAGYWIARKLALPWIANLNDPWDYHLFPGSQPDAVSLSSRISEYWLRRTLSSADAVTFPCARLAAFTLAQAKYKRNYEVIPHIGYSAATAEAQHDFRLVHAGKLGSNEITGRTTRVLLQALRKFLDKRPEAVAATKFLLVGKEDAQTSRIVTELGLTKVVSNAGQVSYEQSLAHIASASVCILIEGKMEEGVYLPSKLADYLTARKPVLALSPARGTVADMSDDPGITRVNHDDPEALESVIAAFYDAYAAGRLGNFAPSNRLIEEFKPEVASRRFLELASQLINRSSKQGNNAKTEYSVHRSVLAPR